ncbi:MAG TPA: metal-dependent hydrolase [Polyangiaceae bacterium]|nr:metal-dependent hydrolase [Polyangiaceae bacterium]
MASIGHVAIGMAAGRRLAPRGRTERTFALMFLFSLLSLLPDVDVVGFAMGVPYGAPFGHRGATHSLAVAATLGLLAAVAASARPASDPGALVRAIRFGAYVALVVASHGLLDAMTDGGKGIALLWPFTTRRFFFPWRPIPVAPIGAAFLSIRGMRVAAVELIEFAPVLAYALLARRSAKASEE